MLTVMLVPFAAGVVAAASHPRRTPEAAAPARTIAPGTEALGRADSWAAYASQDSTGRVCYVVGQPQKSEPGGFARKSPTAMVTHRPAEKITNVVSFVEGYGLKEGSEVALDLGGTTRFQLFTKDDSAWARTSDMDKTIVAAMLKSRQAVVKGTPARGPATTDIYNLSGFAKALALIDKACGVARAGEPALATAAPPTAPNPAPAATAPAVSAPSVAKAKAHKRIHHARHKAKKQTAAQASHP